VRAKKTDANQIEIIQALRDAGYTVEPLHMVGVGVPDILVGGVDRVAGEPRTWLMEIKTDKGKLTKHQIAWRQTWRGQYAVVRTVGEAMAVVGVRFGLAAVRAAGKTK
jgi:hypothetical protein